MAVQLRADILTQAGDPFYEVLPYSCCKCGRPSDELSGLYASALSAAEAERLSKIQPCFICLTALPQSP